MGCIHDKRHFTTAILIFVLAAGLAGCSLLGSDDFSAARVVNAMDRPLVFFGYEREASHLVDVNPQFPVSAITPEGKTFLLPPGASVTLEKGDIEGEYDSDKVLRLFLYEVRGDTAYARDIRDYTYYDLMRRNFRVEIAGFPEWHEFLPD